MLSFQLGAHPRRDPQRGAPEGEAAAPEGEATPEGEAQPDGEAKPEGEAQPEGEAEKTFTQAELDEAVSKAVEEAVAKKDAESKDEVSKLSQTVKDLQDRLDESEADSAVEKMWNEKYSSMYKEEDASEIKQLLKKMKLNQALTPEEMNVMIDKKETQEEILPSSSETIVSKGISEERKEELRRLGGIKTAAK